MKRVLALTLTFLFLLACVPTAQAAESTPTVEDYRAILAELADTYGIQVLMDNAVPAMSLTEFRAHFERRLQALQGSESSVESMAGEVKSYQLPSPRAMPVELSYPLDGPNNSWRVSAEVSSASGTYRFTRIISQWQELSPPPIGVEYFLVSKVRSSSLSSDGRTYSVTLEGSPAEQQLDAYGNRKTYIYLVTRFEYLNFYV